VPTVDADRLALRELVENWALWRDAGDWERFATVWHPTDGWMTATWFQGPAREFIAVSRQGFESGVSILHFLGGHTADDQGGDVSSRPSTANSSGHETGDGGPFVALVSARYLLLTSFKQDGTSMAVPVRVAVDGDRAYFGAWDSSGTSKRVGRTSWVQVVRCTALGMASFGPRIGATARLLAGEEADQAAERLARKHPAWRGYLGSLAHRLTRRQTVYYELRPDEAAKQAAAPPAVTARVPQTNSRRSRRLPPVPLR
jgi:PPOX class probable F420-dependent enzyme